MRTIISALLVSLLLIAEAGVQTKNAAAQTKNAGALVQQTGWEDFAPDDAGFSILFPTKPVEALTEKTKYTLHSFTSVAGRGTYVASYTDYKQIKLEPAAFMIANRDRFIKSMQATLVSNHEITLNGHTGIEFTGVNSAANIRSQIFLVDNRLFQTVTMILKDVDQTTYVNRFFDSFKLTTTK